MLNNVSVTTVLSLCECVCVCYVSDTCLKRPKTGSKKTWATWCVGDDWSFDSAEHRVDTLETIVVMCVLDLIFLTG